MTNKQVEPSLFIIFGSTGDLSRRKLLPAIGRLAAGLSLSDNFQVLGVARDTRQDDTSFRKMALDSMIASGLQPDAIAGFCNRWFHYHTIGNGAPSDYAQLRVSLESRPHRFSSDQRFRGTRSRQTDRLLRQGGRVAGQGPESPDSAFDSPCHGGASRDRRRFCQAT
jgi:hypothetical protein